MANRLDFKSLFSKIGPKVDPKMRQVPLMGNPQKVTPVSLDALL